MGHKFPIEQCAKLESPERLVLLPPARVVALSRAKAGERVLDVGCGPGVFTLPLAGAVGSEGRVVAVDILPEMVERCRARVGQAGLTNVETAASTENAVPVASGSIDLVFACQLMHELHEPARFFAEMRRVLAPGGRIAAVDWEKVDTGIGPPVDKRFSAAESCAILEQNGFAIVAQESVTWANYLLLARVADSSPR